MAISSSAYLTGGVLSGGFGLLSNMQNLSSSQSLMERQAELNRQQAEWSGLNMPSVQMKGLRDAGLNPLLAVGGMSANSAQGVSLGQAENANIGQAMVEGAKTAADAAKNSSAEQLMEQQVEVAKQQEDTLKSQEDLNNANAIKAVQESVNSSKKLNEDLKYIRSQTSNMNADLKIKNDKINSYNERRKIINDVIDWSGEKLGKLWYNFDNHVMRNRRR